MPIDANEAKRLIDILNNNSNINDEDITSILNILNNASKTASDDNPLDDSEIARFKQIALATLRHALTLSSRQLDPSSEKKCKKIIISGLLPLTNLPFWIEPFILSGIELLVDHVLYEKNGSFVSVNTMGIELLLPPYIARIHPEQASVFIIKLCCMDERFNDDDDCDGDEKKDENSPGMDTDTDTSTKMLNPHAAACKYCNDC
jgi:hypothetical protein